jgi:hypothetical protein
MSDKEKSEESGESEESEEQDDSESEKKEDDNPKENNNKAEEKKDDNKNTKENNVSQSSKSKKENKVSENSKKDNNKSKSSKSKQESKASEQSKTDNNKSKSSKSKKENSVSENSKISKKENDRYKNTKDNENETNNKNKTKTKTKSVNLTNTSNTNNTQTKHEFGEVQEELIPPRPELDEIETQNIKLLYPSEEGPAHPRTIYLLNDPEINSNKKSQLYNLTQIEIDQKRYMITYKAYRNAPQSLTGVMKYNQIVKSKLYTNTNLIWKLLDKDKMFPLLRKLNKYQRYNHFPICWQLGRKDNLYLNYLKMQKKFKNEYNFMPDKFLLPQDRDIVQEKMKEYNLFNIKDIYIVKPIANTHGKGVRILTDTTTVPTKGILEKYIYNPHLINRRKYDMRIYILVTGFRPLKIYIYDNGIVRFCSEKYTTDAEKLNNNYVHITNYSVSRAMDILRKGDQEIDYEIKWSLQALKGYFLEKKIKFDPIWERIKDIAIKTILSVFELSTPALKAFKLTSCNLFELYGLDILLDNSFTPWLLECNINPSLNCDMDVDVKVKSKLITDIINIIGLIPFTHDKREKPLDKDNYYMSSIEEAITESLCEFERPTGGFERIFPLKENIEKYKKFIDKPGEQNLNLWEEMLKYKHD